MNFGNIDWKSKTVRNGIIGLVGLALAYWAGEVNLVIALSGAWAILQSVFIRDTIKEGAKAVVASNDQLLVGVHALAASTTPTVVVVDPAHHPTMSTSDASPSSGEDGS